MGRGVRLTTPKGKSPWSVYGLREAQDEINTLVKDLGGEVSGSGIQRSIWDVIREASSSAARFVAASARRVLPGSSHTRDGKSGTARVVESIFAYSRETARHRNPSAIFGVKKRGRYKPFAPAYLEWRAKAGGSLRGMSLATMAEKGTKRWKTPRPFFRPAWATLKTQVILKLTNGYREIIRYHNR